MITPAMIGSSPVVGSSKKMISGSAAMARARPTRFCIPPESSAGKASATSGVSPTRRSFSMAISRASRLGRFSAPRSRRKATFCQTGSESKSAPPWNSIPKRARKASRSPSCMSWPSTKICPASGSISPRMHFSVTDLPEPEPPMITIEVPRGMLRCTSRSTVLSPKALATWRISIIGGSASVISRRTPP
ncbi:hypothetical protein R2601_24230 [Salipiger bermudensis HTCC2601]|uniref:Uncharacterized protein n=1 Tax=Salipiger bermudensis (strain DSM 26914 / JCM 13377 / KCTC 12554 / HTCC2601) TaxID=314265 RepID=Q0FKD3_SALBH|nr:hypothetical protein R2601_24230 [Salipiger bermudensis HTCC2601]